MLVNMIIKTDVAILLLLAVLNENISRTPQMLLCNKHTYVLLHACKWSTYSHR